jgi:hypothetical protein
MSIKCAQITIELFIILNLLLQQLVLHFAVGFYCRVALVRKAADEIRITIFFFKSFGTKKIHEFLGTSNKLTNNVASLVSSGFGPDVTAGRQLDHFGL